MNVMRLGGNGTDRDDNDKCGKVLYVNDVIGRN